MKQMNTGFIRSAMGVAVALTSIAAMAQEEVELTPMERLEQRIEALEAAPTLKRFKVSGYIQAQYQHAQSEADGVNFKLANRANAQEKADGHGFGRFGVRRGRIKFVYEDGLVQGVFQPDYSEKGLSVKDVYLQVKDPVFGSSSLKAGVFNRPFGHEISYSSAQRESPEYARINNAIFPDEHDLGAMLTLAPPSTSAWKSLKLEAGLFAGNGIRAEIDSYLDFIGRLSFNKTVGSDMSYGLGVSAYLGGVYQGTDNVFVVKDGQFVADNNAGKKGSFAGRNYLGFEGQFNVMTAVGLTQLRGEYIFGTHPGTATGAYDFKLTALPAGDTYIRNISGGYITLSQDLGTTPITLVAKYDWYDPNTKTNAGEAVNRGDLAMSNIGVGALWRMNKALRLTAYYDFVHNETNQQLTQLKDNVLTVRLQYKF